MDGESERFIWYHRKGHLQTTCAVKYAMTLTDWHLTQSNISSVHNLLSRNITVHLSICFHILCFITQLTIWQVKWLRGVKVLICNCQNHNETTFKRRNLWRSLERRHVFFIRCTPAYKWHVLYINVHKPRTGTKHKPLTLSKVETCNCYLKEQYFSWFNSYNYLFFGYKCMGLGWFSYAK